MIRIFIKIINNKEDEKVKIPKLEVLEGAFSDKDYIAPSYINISNPKYLEIDNTYYSSLIIVNYHREQSDLILKN